MVGFKDDFAGKWEKLDDEQTVMNQRLLTPDYKTTHGKLRTYLDYQLRYQRILDKYVRNQEASVQVLAFHPTDLAGQNPFSMHRVLLKQGCYTMTDYVESLLVQIL